ncbi:MAG TPA: hypothetical protein VF867_19345 [Arthrobacter sp.]
MAEDTITAETLIPDTFIDDAVNESPAVCGWETALDRLETDIHLAFAGEHSDWEPADDLGPIPPELVDRALQLLSARHEAELMLAEQRATLGRHLGAVDSIPDSKPAPRRLLDVRG